MRISFVLPGMHAVNRGAEVAFESVAAEIGRTGFDDVTVFGSGPPLPGRPYKYRQLGIVRRERFRRAPKLPVLRSDTAYEEATFAASFISKYRPSETDIVLSCSYPFLNWTLSHLPIRGRRPPHVFVTQNGDWPAHSRTAEYRLFRCDGLVCTNPDYYDRNRLRWKCALVPNGVDREIMHPGSPTRAAFGLPDGVPVVLMVSALIESKRVLEGVRAVAQLTDAHLVVAGDGEMRAQAYALAERLMPGRFRCITVPSDHMGELYRSVDVVLHTSCYESFGNVYVEALSTGVPVVAHDYSVTRWIFGENPGLVDARDDAAVVDALSQALRHGKEQAMTLVPGAGERFAWAAVAKEYRSFLEEVASG